jgi:hypothetical protein
MNQRSSRLAVMPRSIRFKGVWYVPTLCSIFITLPFGAYARAQDNLAQRVQQLTDAMKRVQAQMDESNRQLDEMRQELAGLRKQIGSNEATSRPAQIEVDETERSAAQLASQVEDLRERQTVEEAQIAVQEQTKVESESKYPVKVSGLILMNGFVNTSAVDSAATPTFAVPGSGSTGVSIRQTILGLDVRGPHLFGARSHGDLRIDFDASAPATSGYSGGYGTNFVRLRTAHGALDWARTEAFFSLDRPIISPYTPDSLTAIAEPALAWSGNLWNWVPQFGLKQEIALSSAISLQTQFALVDVPDAPSTRIGVPINGDPVIPPTAEQSRWPGIEARVSLIGRPNRLGPQIGLGGFFAPHRSLGGTRFDSWAGTLDLRLPLPSHMELSGAFYRGLALGGLGAGAYKDYVYRTNGNESYFLSLDDIGGWAQWKQRLSERIELNEAFGMDDVPAGQLRPFWSAGLSTYQNLARNRTFTGNIIYSPSSSMLFSLEYRRIESSPVNGSANGSDIIGIAAGYKF